MGTPTGCPYGLGALPSPLMHPLRGCIWGQGPKGPPCPHYRATEGGPLKKQKVSLRLNCELASNLGQITCDLGQSKRVK